MDRILNFFKKIIPSPILLRLLPYYHLLLGFCGALFYGFPSRKMKVVGVTGTKGKTTTSNLIGQILNEAGRKTGILTTVNFKIGDREWVNDTKQTMMGRFALQKFLGQMVKEKCEYAVVETSSEGILQNRHRFVDYDIAVFTNLTPEHIERHGGFLNYRRAKVKLFEKVARKENGVGIYNLDDLSVEYFLEPKIKNKHGYGLKFPIPNFQFSNKSETRNKFQITNVKLSPEKTSFEFNGSKFEIPLIGEFNVYNAAGAICVGLSQGISLEKITDILKRAQRTPGRFETIDKGQNFKVIVDYAHEPASLEAIYKSISDSKLKAPACAEPARRTGRASADRQNSKLICLLGGQGGGRDKWKRPEMGKIAGQYCDLIILANEDPYDENPMNILNDIEAGFSQIADRPEAERVRYGASKWQIAKNYWKIVDRREAIRKALSLAKKGDVVVLTGKGGEVWMCMENGRKVPWNEKQIVEEELEIK